MWIGGRSVNNTAMTQLQPLEEARPTTLAALWVLKRAIGFTYSLHATLYRIPSSCADATVIRWYL